MHVFNQLVAINTCIHLCDVTLTSTPHHCLSLSSLQTRSQQLRRRQVAARVPLPVVIQPPLWFAGHRDAWQTEHFQLQHHQHGTVYHTTSATAKGFHVSRLYLNLKAPFFPHGSESSRERKLTSTLWNFRSRERKFLRSSILNNETANNWGPRSSLGVFSGL